MDDKKLDCFQDVTKSVERDRETEKSNKGSNPNLNPGAISNFITHAPFYSHFSFFPFPVVVTPPPFLV